MNKINTLLLVVMVMVLFGANSYAQNILYGDEQVVGGDFAGDSIAAAWSTFIADFAGASATMDASTGELAVTNINVDKSFSWHVQFNQVLSDPQIEALIEGATYELTFEARTVTDSTRNLTVYFGENGGGWTNYVQSVELTGEMTTFTQEFTLVQKWDTVGASPGMKLGFELGLDRNDVFIDNISLRTKTESVVFNGDFSADPADSLWTPELGTSPGNVTATADIGVVNGEMAITNIVGDGTSYTVQVFQSFSEANKEQLDSIYVGPYEIQFDARTDAESKDFVLYFGENIPGGGWVNFTAGLAPTLTSEMTTYTIPVNVDQTWSSMKLGFEVGGDNSAFYVDNVVLRRVREITPDAPSFNLATVGGIVTITAITQEGVAEFDVYFADSAFTDKDGGRLVGTINVEEGLTLDHTTVAPHPDLAFDFTAYYGVVAKTDKGTGSEITVSSITTGMSSSPNYAYELSSEAIGAVVDAAGNETIPEAATLAGFFPENYVPFTLNSETAKTTEGSAPDNDADASSKHWVGFDASQSLLVIYSEVEDDSLVFNADGEGASGGAWNFDSWEMGLGNYSPESFLNGSTHETLLGGTEPDWQMRAGGLKTETGVRGFFHAYGLIADRINGEIPNSVTLIETSATGYRTLSVLSMAELAGGVTNDAAFTFPTGTEFKTYPMNFSLNDNDATARESQITWASATQNGNWWQNPFQWDVVAFVGSDAVPNSNENEDLGNVKEFSLDQNYPNPFNPTTNITFTLANSSNVTLEVFNMLGQKVATILQQERLSVGQHTQKFDASSLASGMYVYRLSTGNFVQSRKMMLIK